jgi:cytochrome c553
MPHPSHLFPLVGLALVLSAGCSKSPEPAAQQTPPAAAVPITPAHMADHFAKVREVEEAIIRGDLDAAKAPAQWIVDHQEVTGPAGTERPLKEMKAAAQSVATADNLDKAAIAAAAMVGACGHCHAAMKVEPKLPAPAERTGRSDHARHMLEHQAAIVPVSGEWIKGAEALKSAPLRDKAFTDITKETVAAEARVHELAERAINASDQNSRVTIYGTIIGSCASCHGMHGRIWGPGLPKTD